MYEIFRTVLLMSLFGSAATIVLLCLKPITAKKFPAAWQYYVWAAVLIAMLLPGYKLIPKREAQRLPIMNQQQMTAEQPAAPDAAYTAPEVNNITDESAVTYETQGTARPGDIAAYIWLFGVCAFLLVVLLSYTAYLVRKRRNSVRLESCPSLEQAKTELRIKRRIEIRMADDIDSPMLSGVFFPVVYIPCREIPEEKLHMVLLHELTHYKRKDLLIKWISVFVNALHWFNPLCYLLRANISEACEVSCDMSVTKAMSDEERKLYMQTILYLAE